ncbi:MAG: class A beta-lactamase-related serine hydrolase, partial [Betaproteobacteria bacterium]|nr:class A beta-lactamase-related serine hydrolase [Betaproteobacteria bacterium]
MPISSQEQNLTYASPEEVGVSSEKSNLLVNELKLRVTQGELPGAVLMVVRNHKVVIHEPIGFRDSIEQSDMQKDSIFRIASMTKPIVSICALHLMEQGKLSLEDPVSKFLPEFANIQVGVETTNLSGEKELSLVPPSKKMTIQD